MTGSSETNLNPGETDPFAHLHKMSTTAGLGSGDYVAINGTSIACILLGLCSAFVLFDNPVFFIFPVLGLVAGIVAWRQISLSNGTQTGREIAVIGLLLSLGFGGYYSIVKVYSVFQHRADQEQIVSQLHKLGDCLHDGHYVEAYGLFDNEFQKRVPQKEFVGAWSSQEAAKYWGTVQKADWNQLLDFETNPVNDSREAKGTMLLTVSKASQPLRTSMVLRRVDGIWLIDQLPQLFPAKAEEPKTTTGTMGQTLRK
jgi:hypothetical protein